MKKNNVYNVSIKNVRLAMMPRWIVVINIILHINIIKIKIRNKNLT